MGNILNKKFAEYRLKMNDQDFFFFTLAFLLAPTIAAQKAASLICLNVCKRNMPSLWAKYKLEFLGRSGLNYFEIGTYKDELLVFFYNPSHLQKILYNEVHMNFLQQFGYQPKMNLESYLELLKQRYAFGCPPEIGLFLGIPLKDVLGFIMYSGKNPLLCGYWKVYHSPEQAKKTFAGYDRAKARVIELYTNGTAPNSIIQELFK